MYDIACVSHTLATNTHHVCTKSPLMHTSPTHTHILPSMQQAARLNHELSTNAESIKENAEKIKLNKQLPYLVANVVEVSYTFSLCTRTLSWLHGHTCMDTLAWTHRVMPHADLGRARD